MENNPYNDTKYLKHAPIDVRIDNARIATMEFLQLGCDIKEIEATVKLYERDEQYEMAQGVILALADFKKLKDGK